ncbi:hypothetical protein K435DRAFT_923953 [Dendrothele bispora CBS 962.96]|uniref:Uncharacterized protein n=1 Tax=Dendrothele bispora (strain CBS 962.96) TaxID=1314807 RepID=A0A4S8LB75_DENBC|nr:hypothetical protein K435DRAFT_923953 [Dendrothele bispora CBS 962.96]
MSSSTGLLISQVAINTRYLFYAQRPVYGVSPTWDQRFQDCAISAIPYTISAEWFSLFNLLMGDAIIAWRAYALWPQSRIIQSLLCLFLPRICRNLNISSSLSFFEKATYIYNSIEFAINIDQVVVDRGNCILIRAWIFRRTMKSASIRRTHWQSTAYQILILLIECGFFFCAIQLTTALLTLTSATNDPTSFSVDSATLAYLAFIDLSPAASGINPLLIIIIIANKKSILDGSISHPSINASSQPTSDPSSLSTDPPGDIELGGRRNRTLDHRISTLMFSVKPDQEVTPDSTQFSNTTKSGGSVGGFEIGPGVGRVVDIGPINSNNEVKSSGI